MSGVGQGNESRAARRPSGERVDASALERPSRAEWAQQIEALAGRGLETAEIADRLGLSPSTVNIYRRDPRGEAQRARRERYRGSCQGCGVPTTGEGPERARQWCPACARKRRRRWSDEEMLEAIRAWTRLTGEPPTVADWSPAHARAGDPGARRYRAEAPRWPSASAVGRRFGSLEAAIDAATVDPAEGRRRRGS